MIGVLDPVRYAAVYAKVHARLSELLSASAWDELLMAADLAEFVQRLAGTSYHDVVEFARQEAGDGVVEVVSLERALRGHLARAFLRPLTFVPAKPRNLLMWRWRHFEMDNLKTVLRAVDRDIAPDRARATLVPLGAVSELAWNDLVEVDSIPAVVESLAGTFYGSALEPALDRYRREESLLILEVRLDLAYFRRLLEMIRDLGGRDREEAERFLGTMVDSRSVLWAFRYRVYYELSPEEILNYSLHRGVRVDVSTIRAIAQGATVLEVLRHIWDGDLPNLDRLQNLSEEEALEEAEDIFSLYLFDQAQRVRGQYAMHLGVVLGYETLLETEIYDLISIAEGKAAKWSANEIRPYLITVHR